MRSLKFVCEMEVSDRRQPDASPSPIRAATFLTPST